MSYAGKPSYTENSILIGNGSEKFKEVPVEESAHYLVGENSNMPSWNPVGNCDHVTFSNNVTITSGTGIPTSSQPKGSLYLKTDGTALTGRLYVATNSIGSWTGIDSVL